MSRWKSDSHFLLRDSDLRRKSVGKKARAVSSETLCYGYIADNELKASDIGQNNTEEVYHGY
jgi:hypothetical protein